MLSFVILTRLSLILFLPRCALCRFTCLLAARLIDLCSGCVRKSDAIQTAELWHILPTLSFIGSIDACASRESVGDVRRPPVIARVPSLWIDMSLPIAAVDPRCPESCGGEHHVLRPYSIRGSATPIYSLLAARGVSPQLSLVALRIWAAPLGPCSRASLTSSTLAPC